MKLYKEDLQGNTFNLTKRILKIHCQSKDTLYFVTIRYADMGEGISALSETSRPFYVGNSTKKQHSMTMASL